ncbi:MAG: M12 family metallo-peptidase [Flavobacteriales bacterium]
MKLCVLLLFALFVGHSNFAQNSHSDWTNVRNGDISQPVNIEIEGINYEFTLVKNNSFSDALLDINPHLKSFDIQCYKSDIKGKVTLDNSQVFIHLKQGKNLFTYHLEPETQNYIISKSSEKAECGTKNSPKFFGQNHITSSVATQKSASDLNNGDILKTYRLALIGTGEFTENNGGNASDALTIATATVNGINLIFEAEASISMTLVESQFYLDSNTDPFTPDQAGGDSRTNQAAEVMAMNFTDSSYDLGHVLHHFDSGTGWGAGGIAGLGVVCDDGTFFSTAGDSDGLTGPNKAAAWSGSFNNTSNSWIQLITHEFGHQFDALHTFNGGGNANCNSGISSISAYEIGSGTTLMSYSGLCPSNQNVPSNGAADNYFHSTSLDRIFTFSNSLATNCAVEINTGNSIPEALLSYTESPTIPIGTPFELSGSGNDADGDEVSYVWEQIDEDGPGNPTQGFLGADAANSALAPLFKSSPPSLSPERVFPSLNNILNGENEDQSFEALPQVTRSISMSFIVRDGNGGVTSEGLIINSSSTAGPFKISSNNLPETWTAGNGNTAIITWDVANTDNTEIDCQHVDIYFSQNNGESFPYLLAENVPNSGTATIQVPNLPTAIGRIKIKASNNIFFDINDAFITIDSTCEADGTSFIPAEDVEAEEGDPILNLDLTPEYGMVISEFSGTLDSSDSPTNLVTESNGSCVNFNGNATFGEAFSFQVDQSGSYTFSRTSGPFGLLLHVYNDEYIPSAPCTNWITGSFDNENSSINSNITVDLTADLDYQLVITGFSDFLPELPADFTVTYSGPGDVLDGSAAPDGFIYQYVIVDESSQIVDIALDADLTTYESGIYSVLGLSSDNSTDFSSYINAALDLLESDILSLTVCGGFSSNFIEVNILASEDCLGDFNGDGLITISDLSPFLSQFGCLENCTADLNGDGIVTIGDLSPFLASFGTSCD